MAALQAFENTSTNVAASQMRNALNKLADTVTDPAEKKVSRHDKRAPLQYPADRSSYCPRSGLKACSNETSECSVVGLEEGYYAIRALY